MKNTVVINITTVICNDYKYIFTEQFEKTRGLGLLEKCKNYTSIVFAPFNMKMLLQKN